jgi:hypothetical protein
LGDANLDGFVDGLDFIIWNDHKFTAEAAWCAGDFNADGFVDGQDFIVWNANKFTSADGMRDLETRDGVVAFAPTNHANAKLAAAEHPPLNQPELLTNFEFRVTSGHRYIYKVFCVAAARGVTVGSETVTIDANGNARND